LVSTAHSTWSAASYRFRIVVENANAEEPHAVWDVRRLATVDSTNTYLLGLARHGEPEGIVVVADHQAAGRGRLGRVWEAPPGSSLLVSVLLRPGRRVRLAQAHLLTAITAMAAADACRAVAGILPELHWPNDLWVEGRKVGGILAETDLAGDELAAVVVGLGLNVNWPDEFPGELADIATSLNHLAGHAIDADRLLDTILSELGVRYRRLLASPVAAAGEYRLRCATVGQNVRALTGDGEVVGRAIDVTDEGHLVIDTGREHRTIAVGDVTHLRPA
jgi:BirA family transcriptional regulator, biotin operon repressor / biotin---[acetyl-CoA-carboxylase] ligase